MTNSLNHSLAGLAEDAAKLTSALNGAKSAFIKAGRPDAVDWIAFELTGYSDASVIPTYRRVPAITKGVITKGRETINDYILPTEYLTVKAERANLSTGIPMLMETPALHEAVRRGDDFFVQSIHSDFNVLYTRGLSNVMPGYRVERAWHQIRFTELQTLVVTVSDRLHHLMAGINRQPA